jgi:riboflavin kinase/FMN adenylyltransferase
MKVVHLSYPFSLQLSTHTVLAIGDFDGVHLGHQKVIERAVSLAKNHQSQAAVMTFHPHPREILGLQKYESLLTPFAHKLDLLHDLEIDVLYVVEFNKTLAQVSAEQFFHEVLCQFQLKAVVIGFDFTYGHRGLVTASHLRELAEKNDAFQVEIIQPYILNGDKVSSTRIRNHLETGDVIEIPELMGRAYDMIGIVRHGDGRGRKLGFPTANLELDGCYIFPKLGVYAVRAIVDDHTYQAVVNIGVRPTFLDDPEHANVEVHLLDFNGDLYDRTLKIELIEYLREERKFNGVEQLVQQIKADIAKARTIFS